MAANVPTGLYRNHVGAELYVVGIAMSLTGVNTIGGDIAIAESRDELFGRTKEYLVTEKSLREAGYELIEHAEASR